MIEYRKYVLDSGLTVVTHEAWDTPMATVNVLYGVGSRNEDWGRTGFAHLFEHLMFGGTAKVPDFDAVVSGIGGECNAFTNTDYTNYYMTVPAEELSTALMLESDRMGGLELTQKALEVQQKVVTEEYNQRYRNQPYGDTWLLLRPLCYKVHPYRWATIGADIRDVGEATLEDVVAFHERWYRPENAILAIAAPMKHEEMMEKVAESWLSTSRNRLSVTGYNLPAEPEQKEPRELRVKRDVPAPMVMLAWPMCGHADRLFRACDLISDVLGNGVSSRLQQRLVREQGLFTEADACISGEADPGLMVLSGKVADGVSVEAALDGLRKEAYDLRDKGVDEYELQKVINKYENTFVYGQYKAQDRAMGLCYYTWMGDTELVNREPEEYRKVKVEDIAAAAKMVFAERRENVLVMDKD